MTVKLSGLAADKRAVAELTIDPAHLCLLVLDGDDERRRGLLAALHEGGFRTVGGPLGEIDRLVSGSTVLDVALVALDGTDAGTIATLREALTPETPILGVTADGTPAGRRRAAELGVNDFVLAPGERAERRRRITAALSTVRESLSLLAAVADFHDDDSNQHAQRVGAVATAIARQLALPEAFVAMLGEAATLPDIGKVGSSRRILLKPGKLSEPEWVHMMQHVDVGGQILGAAQSPLLVLAGEISRTHHEHWDGSGYTAGLHGEQIPISGRIVAVADVWDTLTHDRPYREAWTPERAFAEIQEQAGLHFDPAVVEAFSALELGTLTHLGDDGRRAA